MPNPAITDVHIQLGKLRTGRGNNVTKGNGDHIRTMGWFRGSDITSGEPQSGNYWEKVYNVTITTHGGKKAWKGWIVGYEQSGNGLFWQWNFLVINAKNEAALDQGETTITISVTNPDTGATVTDTPPPQQPPITLEEVP